MKQLKSSLGDLRRIFVRTITLRDIAEPLASFDSATPCSEVGNFMEKRGYDVVGVREHGIVSGFVLREELSGGVIGRHIERFGAGDLLPDSEPLTSAFEALRDHRHVFINVLGHAGGIITRGDLQKAPVRLWLFGLVSLLEMQMLRIVREHHPAEAWAHMLTLERLEGARRLFDERRRRKEESDLSDCLQLGDKASIMMKDPVLFELSGFSSKRALEHFFKNVGTLRNALAHSNDILCGKWPDLVNMVRDLESLLERLEGAMPARNDRSGMHPM